MIAVRKAAQLLGVERAKIKGGGWYDSGERAMRWEIEGLALEPQVNEEDNSV
jgi:hypothetical protein